MEISALNLNHYEQMIRFIPDEKKEELNLRFEQRESKDASEEFLQNWARRDWKALLPKLPEKKHEVVARGALVALKNNLICKEDFCSYLLAYNAFVEFVKDQTFQVLYHESSSRPPATFTAFVRVEFEESFKVHDFESESSVIKNYFHLTRYEWSLFAERMKHETPQQKQYLTFLLPKMGTFSTIFERVVEIVKVGHLLKTGSTREMVVPSHKMIHHFFEVKRSIMGHNAHVNFEYLMGKLEEEHVKILKQEGRVPCGLSHPDIADYRTYIRDATIDLFHGVGPYAFAFHDFYHALRELLTNQNYRKIRNRWADLLVSSQNENAKKAAEVLIDGEGPVNIFNNVFCDFQTIHRGIAAWFKRAECADPQIKQILFHDLLNHAEEYERDYDFAIFDDLSEKIDEFINFVLSYPFKEHLESNLQLRFCLGVMCFHGHGFNKDLNSAYDLFSKVANTLNSGPAHYYCGRICYEWMISTPHDQPEKEKFMNLAMQYLNKSIELGTRKTYDFIAETSGFYTEENRLNVRSGLAKTFYVETFLLKPNFDWRLNETLVTPLKIAETYFDLFLVYAHQGNLQSCLVVAECFLRIPHLKDEREAHRWCERSARSDEYPVSKRYLGDIYRLGIGVERDLNKALDLYQSALKIFQSGRQTFQKIFFPLETIEQEVKGLLELIEALSNPESSYRSLPWPSRIISG